MNSTWVPHGFIQSKDLEEVYENARASSLEDPKEYRSIHLIEDLCHQVWFPGSDFKTNSQYPPSDSKGPNKACDLATQSIDREHNCHMLIFHEGKRARNKTGSKIRILETQAQGYCEEFLKSNENVSMVYSNTFAGASVRFWSFTRGDNKLRGFWAGDKKDEFKHYKDVGLDENLRELQRAIDAMKSMPVSALRRGQDHSQIGATSSISKYTVSAPSSSMPGASYTGAGSVYTYPIRIATPSPELNPGAGEAGLGASPPAEMVPQGAVHVEVELEISGDGSEIFHFDYGQNHYAKKLEEWEERTVSVQGRTYDCFIYTGQKSGKHF